MKDAEKLEIIKRIEQKIDEVPASPEGFYSTGSITYIAGLRKAIDIIREVG